MRRDIQGLRALAVLAVIANHLWGWPSGGFVGVDVFFVVSGYLITGLLLREQARTGRVSVADFYRRRARRILPVALLVLVTTTLAAGLLVNGARGRTVAVDGLWSLLFVSNWHFAVIGTDYWQLDSTSPLQHFWSLGVEEQFYLGWPWLLMGAVALSAGRRRLGPPVLAVVVVSFGYSLWHTGAEPTWAYFSTLDRAWELAVGALVAVTAPRAARLPGRLLSVLGGAGLAGVLISLFIVSPGSGFPAPWAVLPVAATAMVVAAGADGVRRGPFVLVNPVAGYVGDLSYSLYLWHFPVVVLGRAFFPRGGGEYVVWVLGLTAALSVASYHLLEDPVRRSAWLEPAARRRVRPAAEAAVRPRVALTLSGIAGLVAVTVVSAALVRTYASSDDEPAALAPLTTSPPGATSPTLEAHERRVRASLAAEEFPDLEPGLDDLGVLQWQEDLERTVGCYDVYPRNLASCVNGDADAERTAVVVGDSVAMSFMPGIVTALTAHGFRVQQVTKGQCPAWDVATDYSSGGADASCPRFHDWSRAVVRRQRPDLVILISAYLTAGRLSSGAGGDLAAEEIRAGAVRQIRAFQRYAGRVVVLEPAPQSTTELRDCVTRFGEPADCAVHVDRGFTRVEEAERNAAAMTGATFVDTRSWFCDPSGVCPGFVGRTPVRVDRTHLSVQYSEQLAPLLAERLLGRRGGRE